MVSLHIFFSVDCFHCFLWVSEQHKSGVLITHFTIIKLLVMSKTVRGMGQHAQLPVVLQGPVPLVESVSNLTLKEIDIKLGGL